MKTLKRRRLERKTDYKARLALLESGKPRLILRKTNRYMNAQIVESKNAHDKIIFGVTSADLIDKGWPIEHRGRLKSLGAGYLTGLLLGKEAKGKVREAILDIGMNRNIPKSRLYAVLKGVIESGISIPHDPSVLPTDEMLEKNEITRPLIKKLKEKII
ncbi:50S ribosomal protein L18 [Candidatus Pacearchaeota archaeon]|nr:50S ribosomal protein L18 [Candidatus Pacearchaeota archaeon]